MISWLLETALPWVWDFALSVLRGTWRAVVLELVSAS